MGRNSQIQWTDDTWNFLKGCTPVSPGCLNCYAATLAHQKANHPNEKIARQFAGTTEMKGGRAVFNGHINIVPHLLTKPLHWREPRRIFVNSLSDLFHENVPEDVIVRAFAVMMLTPHHTYQVLTKRPERMREVVSGLHTWVLKRAAIDVLLPGKLDTGTNNITGLLPKHHQQRLHDLTNENALPHVWLGTSVEDQPRAEERIPHLLATPAAVRFLSCEPLLGPVDLTRWLRAAWIRSSPIPGVEDYRYPAPLHWVIVGGESGKYARPFNLAWARSLVRQCREAGVAVFVKQLGAQPYYAESFSGEIERPGLRARFAGVDLESTIQLRDSHGGDWNEWPADLRVREFPEEVPHA